MPGHLIAFEGLDQSGKQTQAERLAEALAAAGRRTELFSFPDYTTPIGAEIGHVLAGGRELPADALQLLYIANRYEHRPRIERALNDDVVVICDRYLASSIAYGEAQGLDAQWLFDTQRHLPRASLTLLLDIAPETSLARKQAARDRYERDLTLLARVRESYRRQSAQDGWLYIDGTQDRDAVTETIHQAVRTRLALL